MPQIPHKKYISFGASTILVRLLTVALLVGQGPSYLSYPQFHLSYPLSYPLHKAQARAKIAQKRPQMAEDWPQIHYRYKSFVDFIVTCAPQSPQDQMRRDECSLDRDLRFPIFSQWDLRFPELNIYY